MNKSFLLVITSIMIVGLLTTTSSVFAEEHPVLMKSTADRLSPKSYGSSTGICGVEYCSGFTPTVNTSNPELLDTHVMQTRTIAIENALRGGEAGQILREYWNYKGLTPDEGRDMSLGVFGTPKPTENMVPKDNSPKIIPENEKSFFAKEPKPTISTVITIKDKQTITRNMQSSVFANPDFPSYKPTTVNTVPKTVSNIENTNGTSLLDISDNSTVIDVLMTAEPMGVCGENTILLNGVCQPDYEAIMKELLS